MQFTDAQTAAFKAAYGSTLSEEQWNLFISECERRDLIPGQHVVAQVRNAMEYSAALNRRVSVPKLALITTVNALRLIADRSGKYEGHGPFVYYYSNAANDDLRESKIPLGRVPHAVSVEGYRKGWKWPLFYTARYEAYVQLKDGGDGKRVPTMMWATRGEEQLAKCAEAGMLRTVAPEECGNLYISEEFEDDVKATSGPPDTTTAQVPNATVAPSVNQSAGTNATSAGANPAPAAEVKPLKRGVGDTRVEPAPLLEGKNRLPDETGTAPVEQQPWAGQFEKKGTDGVAGTVNTAPPAPPEAKVVVPAQPTPQSQPVAAPAPIADGLPTPDQYRQLVNGRAAKIARDVLPKAGIKPVEAGNLLKEYLLNGSGKPDLKKILVVDFERLLKVLEDSTPEQAAELVKKK